MTKSLSCFFLVSALLVAVLTGCPNNDPEVIGQQQLSGSVSAAGAFSAGQLIVADVSDVSGTGALTVQWQASGTIDGTFTNVTETDGAVGDIAGIANASFTPAPGFAGKFVKVRVTRAGYGGNLMSLPFIIVGQGVRPEVTGVSISHPLTGPLSIVRGNSVQLQAKVLGKDVDDIQYVIWSLLTPPSAAGTGIDQDGLLSIADTETSVALTVRAVSVFNNIVTGSAVANITASDWSNWKPDVEDDTKLPEVRTGADVFFIAPNGNDDTGNGSIENPWRSLGRANQSLQSGGALYIRAGRYEIDGRIAAGSISDVMANREFNVSGTAGNPTLYSAYPPDLENGQRPVFDFTHLTTTGRVTAMQIRGNWIHVFGIDVTGFEAFAPGTATTGVGLSYSGQHITVEYNRVYNVAGNAFRGAGQFLLIINNDAFQLRSRQQLFSNMNHDGFGQNGGPNDWGNVFYGNRSWATSDDGIDTLSKFDTVVIERNWFAYSSSIYKDGTTYEQWTTTLDNDLLELSRFNYGRGNGMKIGGWNMNNNLAATNANYFGKMQQVARYNLVIGARNTGVSANFHVGGSYFTYNTAWNNNDNYDFMSRKGPTWTSTNNNTQDASRVVNGQNIFATGNLAIPGGPNQTGFNVTHLDFTSGNVVNPAVSGMREPRGAGLSQIWNNSWDLVDNGASKTRGEANWIEGIMLHGFIIPAPDLWTGLPWPQQIVHEGKTYNFRSPSQDGGPTHEMKDMVWFPRGASGPRGTPQNPRLAWDHLGYWNNWDDKTNDIIQNAIGITDADFMSFDETLFLAPRKKNGSLPETPFLRPVPGGKAEGMGHTAPDANHEGAGTGPSALLNGNFHLWKYRAGATPSLDEEFTPIPGAPPFPY